MPQKKQHDGSDRVRVTVDLGRLTLGSLGRVTQKIVKRAEAANAPHTATVR